VGPCAAWKTGACSAAAGSRMGQRPRQGAAGAWACLYVTRVGKRDGLCKPKVLGHAASGAKGTWAERGRERGERTYNATPSTVRLEGRRPWQGGGEQGLACERCVRVVWCVCANAKCVLSDGDALEWANDDETLATASTHGQVP
jgi:hypothetical protein